MKGEEPVDKNCLLKLGWLRTSPYGCPKTTYSPVSQNELASPLPSWAVFHSSIHLSQPTLHWFYGSTLASGLPWGPTVPDFTSPPVLLPPVTPRTLLCFHHIKLHRAQMRISCLHLSKFSGVQDPATGLFYPSLLPCVGPGWTLQLPVQFQWCGTLEERGEA